jgi:hypothetical protein
MSSYIVRFFKQVLGDEGQTCEACQASIDVSASSQDEAACLAKERFREQHGTRDWTLHADRIEIKPSEFPS